MKRTTDSFPTDRFYPLPESVSVNGKEYAINHTFGTALSFMNYVDESKETDDKTFLDTVLSLWYPIVPEDRDAAMNAALQFYCGGTMPQKGYYTPVFAPADYKKNVYFDFLKNYGIDLNRDDLHWWVFRELLLALRERRTKWI